MKRIRINFADFWTGFRPEASVFFQLLSQHFDCQLCNDPDFLIYSCFGKQHLNHRGIRIFYTGENLRADFTTCDYAFTFDHLDHPRHYRLPLYALECGPQQLIKPADFDAAKALQGKTKFCNFVYGNPRGRVRNRFFRKLSEYKHVDAGGRLFNNMGRVHGNVKEKLQLIKDYKFTMSFENASFPGYTTEKILHPMWVNSLPIYWGNPLVQLDFNTRSFVNYFDFRKEDEVIERIIALDQDDDLYLQTLRQPWFQHNQPPACFDRGKLVEVFAKIFASERTPIAISGYGSLPNRVQRFARRVSRSARRISRDVAHVLSPSHHLAHRASLRSGSADE